MPEPKTTDLGLSVLPPPKNRCPICAVKHPVEQAHDATSFYYQVLFCNTYGRSATWADAIAHCPEKIKKNWEEYLPKVGIDINSTDVRGGITTEEERDRRINNAKKQK